jgi:hypothetical protein
MKSVEEDEVVQVELSSREQRRLVFKWSAAGKEPTAAAMTTY